MRKIIICDKNKKLIDYLKNTVPKGPNKMGIGLKFVCGDIIVLHDKTPNSKIVTASNPEFSPDGGLDALLKAKYSWKNAKEFSWSEDLFYVCSVGSDRKATKSIVERALAGVLGYATKHTMLLTGIGTGIGGMAIEELGGLILKVLRYSNLSGSDLRYSDLSYSDLRGSNLRGSNLRGSDLSSAKILKVRHNEATAFFALSCPAEGAFVGWKKASGCIVKLQIPDKAKRSSATSRKCRCSEAKVLAIYDGKKKIKKVASSHNSDCVYEVGKTVKPKKVFDPDRWNECSSGIHFFITKEEAEQYY